MSIRLERLQSDLKQKLNILLKTEVNNTYASYCNVTYVKVSPDLSYAKVYIDTLSNHQKALSALKSISGFLRSQLAKSINRRTTPKLIFEIDETIQHSNKIEKLLKDLTEEK